jgi:hypothetical protein
MIGAIGQAKKPDAPANEAKTRPEPAAAHAS